MQNIRGIPYQRHHITYLDKGYESLSHCRAAFHGDNFLVWQLVENTKMKRPRAVGIEMPFGKTLANSKLISNWRGQKIQLTAVGKIYKLAVLLNNIHTCLYGSTVSEYFDCRPPTLSDYMRCPQRGIIINI